MKRDRADDASQLESDDLIDSAQKRLKVEIEASEVEGLDMDELPVTALSNGNTLRGQVKKGTECPYLDTISRQVHQGSPCIITCQAHGAADLPGWFCMRLA